MPPAVSRVLLPIPLKPKSLHLTSSLSESRAGCSTPTRAISSVVATIPSWSCRYEVTAHPYAVAMECAMLAPKAEVSIFPWKEPKERLPLAVRQVHSFLKAHQPA